MRTDAEDAALFLVATVLLFSDVIASLFLMSALGFIPMFAGAVCWTVITTDVLVRMFRRYQDEEA